MILQSKLEVALYSAELFAERSKSIVAKIAWCADGHALDKCMTYIDGQPRDDVDCLASYVGEIVTTIKAAKSVAPQCNDILTEANIELAKLSSVRPGLHVADKRFNHAHEALLSVAIHLSCGLGAWDHCLGESVEVGRTLNVEGLRENFYDACQYLAQDPFMLDRAEFDELVANAKQENALARRWDRERNEQSNGKAQSGSNVLPAVDLELNQVRYAGECYNVTPDQALLFKLMVEKYPDHINASDTFPKPSELKKKLPSPLKAIVRTSGGYRLDLG